MLHCIKNKHQHHNLSLLWASGRGISSFRKNSGAACRKSGKAGKITYDEPGESQNHDLGSWVCYTPKVTSKSNVHPGLRNPGWLISEVPLQIVTMPPTIKQPICIYISIYGPVLRLSTPPPWVGSPGSSPNSLLFASYSELLSLQEGKMNSFFWFSTPPFISQRFYAFLFSPKVNTGNSQLRHMNYRPRSFPGAKFAGKMATMAMK